MRTTSGNSPERVVKPWKINLFCCVTVSLLLLILSLLTGCVTDSSSKRNTLNLYQTPVLRLESGTVVDTKDGMYKVQQDEIWHSDYRYRQLELKVISQ